MHMRRQQTYLLVLVLLYDAYTVQYICSILIHTPCPSHIEYLWSPISMLGFFYIDKYTVGVLACCCPLVRGMLGWSSLHSNKDTICLEKQHKLRRKNQVLFPLDHIK